MGNNHTFFLDDCYITYQLAVHRIVLFYGKYFVNNLNLIMPNKNPNVKTLLNAMPILLLLHISS
jgi:hypothetical protein